jgi:hypothetical protein
LPCMVVMVNLLDLRIALQRHAVIAVFLAHQ